MGCPRGLRPTRPTASGALPISPTRTTASPPMPPKPQSKLASAKAALARDFVKPAKLVDMELPTGVQQLPNPNHVPDEGTVIVDLPHMGPTTVEKVDGTVTIAQSGQGTNPKKIAARWTPHLMEKLYYWAMCDDGRFSLPAIGMIMERVHGKPRPAEPDADQQAIDMSMLPVRERIKALLDARDRPPDPLADAVPLTPPHSP